MYFYFYQVSMILSLIISLSVIVLTWRRRYFPGAGAMVALVTATFVWTLGFFLEANSDTLARQLFFNNVGYLGSMSVPVAWFVFALNYSNTGKLIRGWKTIFFCIFPFIITVFIWTNNWHHLIWSDEHLSQSGPFLVTVKTYGPLFWAALTHNYLLIAAGGIVLLRRLFIGPRLYAEQAIALIVAVCLPWLWNIIYVFNLAPLPRKDLTPVMFAISGIALTLGLIRFRLFTTIPFARKFIIQQLNDGVLVFDAHNHLVEANPMAQKILAIDKSAIGKRQEDLSVLSPVFERLSSAGFKREELPLTVSGEKRLYELEKSPMLVHGKQQVGWLAMLHDFTERKQAEEQYRLIAEYSADVIYKLTIKGEQYTYVSPSVERLLGYTDKEALAMKSKDVLTPESYEKQNIELKKDLQHGTFTSILQLEAIHKDGHIVPIEVHGRLVCDEKGEPVEIVGVVRDITERKKMTEQLMMQDRLASIGQLTSGLAHELNNPLTSVISFSSLLLNREFPEDVKQDLQVIQDEAKRTADIVKNLLAFTRKQPRGKQPMNINESIQKVMDLRAYEQKVNNIQVNINLDPELPQVIGNESQLQQVFFDIVINAEYFMLEAHGEGTLKITTEKAGNYIRVLFADNGPGISSENMKHLYTPFFTTKEVGQGTGLSLSICSGIITEHGGRIMAESEPGKGATFIVELPEYDRLAGENDNE
ncbi:MAG: histidine kinase N-terminal 7TM domain-containing protein [Dehalococcoidales bacterium]